MSESDDQQNNSNSPSPYSLGELDEKGTYWIEYPTGSGTWYYRDAPKDDWVVWKN